MKQLLLLVNATKQQQGSCSAVTLDVQFGASTHLVSMQWSGLSCVPGAAAGSTFKLSLQQR